ncbi:MobA/MobL family protein, partial [Endozoicomonas sp. SM1973]
ALERAGHQERIDHRSLKDQGIDREPTKHLGPKATAMERNGARSDRGEENREIKARNDNVLKLAETQSEIRGLQEEKRKQEAYEERFSIPENWQAREQAILNNHRELFSLNEKRQALSQQHKASHQIALEPVNTYDDYVKQDKALREHKDRVFQYEEQLSFGQRQVDSLEAGGLWSQLKVRLAEKGYLTFGETAKAVEYRNKNAQALARSEALRDERKETLYNNPLEKQRINQLIARDSHRQTQAHFDALSYEKKLNVLNTHYQRVHTHTQTLVDLENKDAETYNREKIERLKSLEKEIKNTEKTLENSPALLRRKKDNTPLNDMEAAQHLPEFKAYNREWHEKYQDKINEWKTFEKQRPELAERLLNGTTKTRYKLLEELKAAKAERYDTLQRHANDPKNARAIENIKRQYALEGPESHSKQRLEKLRQEYTRVAESPSRGGWRDVKDAQRQIQSKGLHNASNKKMLNEGQRRTTKKEMDLETQRAYKQRRKTKSRGQSKDWGMSR